MIETLKESHDDEKQFHEEAAGRFRSEYDRLQKRLEAMYVDKLDGKIAEDFMIEDQGSGDPNRTGCSGRSRSIRRSTELTGTRESNVWNLPAEPTTFLSSKSLASSVVCSIFDFRTQFGKTNNSQSSIASPLTRLRMRRTDCKKNSHRF